MKVAVGVLVWLIIAAGLAWPDLELRETVPFSGTFAASVAGEAVLYRGEGVMTWRLRDGDEGEVLLLGRGDFSGVELRGMSTGRRYRIEEHALPVIVIPVLNRKVIYRVEKLMVIGERGEPAGLLNWCLEVTAVGRGCYEVLAWLRVENALIPG